MHELGIIVHVMRTVEEVAAENNLTEIRSVTCEIGEVSGVVPEYMADCWGYARSRSELLKDSELIFFSRNNTRFSSFVSHRVY
jgi:hydrogenase nickel incorporation protein HypA/HybF